LRGKCWQPLVSIRQKSPVLSRCASRSKQSKSAAIAAQPLIIRPRVPPELSSDLLETQEARQQAIELAAPAP